MAYNKHINKVYVKTTPAFDKKADKYLSEEALETFLTHIANNPEDGDIIPKSGGIRKIRWETGDNNKGKSGGVRILYHYADNLLVLLITLYAKSEKENISDTERNALKQQLPLLLDKYRGEI